MLGRWVDRFHRSAPSVVATQQNTKSILEAKLRSACEEFIVEAAAPATGPILALLQR